MQDYLATAKQIADSIDLRYFIPGKTGIEAKQEGAITRLASCPMCGHHDCFTIYNNNPSFFYCFSCGAKGNAINFLMKTCEIPFKKAVSILQGEESISISPAKEAEKIKKEEKERIRRAKKIWESASTPSQAEIENILSQRHFPFFLKEQALEILSKSIRINEWEGKWAIIPQWTNNEITGICRVWLDCTSQKLDLGKKGVFLFHKVREMGNFSERNETCFIVESFFNGLCLHSLGYSALVLFSATNKSALESSIKGIPSSWNIVFWLDRGVEKQQEEYCAKYNVPGIWFEEEKPNGYDINDMLRDSPESFMFDIESYLSKASREYPKTKEAFLLSDTHEIPSEKHEKIETVKKAYEKIEESQGKSFVILAPTGAGKTTETALKIVERMRKKLPTIYVASQKSDMYQFLEKSLYPLMTETERKKVQIVSKEESSKIEGYPQDGIIITHKTFFTRKGVSPYHYSAMLWAGNKKAPKNVWVIIDEVQAYIENQKFIIKRGGRFAVKEFDEHGVTRKEICEECLAFNNRGNCLQCKLSDKNYLYCQTNGILEIRTHIEGRTGKDFNANDLPALDFKSETRYKTLSIREIEEREIKSRQYTSEKIGENPTLEKIFNDLLENAHKPKCYIFSPIDREKEEPADWTTLKLYFEQAQFCSKNEKEIIEEKRKIKENYIFPKMSCQIEIYELLDKSSLLWLSGNSNIEKIIFLGATLREDEKEFLGACCKNLNIYEITESKQKLDELAIVMFKKKIDFVKNEKGKGKQVLIQNLVDSIGEKERILVFEAKKNNARELYREFPRDYPIAILNGDDVTMEDREVLVNKKGDGDYRIGVTWENGPLGRGINRPMDYIAIIDTANYLPVICYGHGEGITPEKVEQGYREKVEDTSIQCGGRILRGSGRKLIVLHNTQEIEPCLENIIKKWQVMVASTIKTIIVEEEQEYLANSCVEYIRHGKFLEKSEREFLIERSASKKKNEMSKEEREKIDGLKEEEKEKYQEARENAIQEGKKERQVEKDSKRLERLILKASQMKKEGKNWREICLSLNLARHKDLKEIIMQEIGF
ncbi:MAG: hypothetical protein HUU50_21860 [Candidatus Brocadiae bacterium]|nr:hypothetical protein [Candidatus Brocadiia bacterium]